MKEEIAKKWIEALTSGEYQQHRGALRSSVGFCCLGVLCDISGVSNWNVFRFGAPRVGYTYENESNYLPKSVCDWAGIEHFSQTMGTLSNKNDSGEEFDKIAEYIAHKWREI